MSRRFKWSWPIRARLTATYGALFLISGAAVLGITYVLVDQATSTESVVVVLPDGSGIAANVDIDDAGTTGGAHINGEGENPGMSVPDPDPTQLRDLATKQHHDRMLTLLTQSGIALGIMAVISIVLGWVMAGRALHPLTAITTTTRRITAQNLDERLANDGPDDEVKELGNTINAFLARLDESFSAQRQFVANASHELRTPLARQRTLAQVALDDPHATADSLRTAHERVLAAGAQQEHMIEALLTLARGQAVLDRFEPVDLAEMVRTAVKESQPDAQTRGVSIVTSLATATVPGDPALLDMLIVNITTEARDGNAELTVSNTGPVVPRDAVEDLLEPFRRLDKTRTLSGEGSGLGLPIVKAIAQAHHGNLTVEPRPDGGLHIKVVFT